jgi:hypothetical protein
MLSPLEVITHTDKWHDRSERLCGIYLMIARRELRTLEEGGSLNAFVIESILFHSASLEEAKEKQVCFRSYINVHERILVRLLRARGMSFHPPDFIGKFLQAAAGRFAVCIIVLVVNESLHTTRAAASQMTPHSPNPELTGRAEKF